jgi:uncharacterized protein YbjT (DUF2867 family)
MKLRIIITGTTGMVGEGVLHECLQRDDVEAVLSVSRKELSMTHPKLKSILHADFYDLSAIKEELKGYNTCLFCLGVSSVGMGEEEYTKKTYDLTIAFAKAVKEVNADVTFCYISGVATDSTEKGRSMWARVKGRTENELLKLFPKAYMFRPGYMQPTKGLKHTLKYYKFIDWMYPVLRGVFPAYVCTLKDLGRAMINTSKNGYEKRTLEVKDIVRVGRS